MAAFHYKSKSMAMKMFFCISFIFHLSSIFLVNCVKLNERRLLLPFNNGVSTNYTLIATNEACYEWSSSRSDVAIVEPIIDPKKGCAQKALVSVISRLPKRQSTLILATNKVTGSVTRCDVEVDVIKSLEIVTTTREIVLDDLPERLEVHAKNERNDTFTSIGGVQFEWTFNPEDVVQYCVWSTSSYIGPSFVKYWESRESKASIILIKGVKTGSAKVKVKIIGETYKKIDPIEIELHVVPILGLIPSNDVYLISGSKIEFNAEIIKHEARIPIQLPSNQYLLEILNTKIASLDSTNKIVEAKKEGTTKLTLKDRNLVISDETRQPTTTIHVVRPSYMSIQIIQSKNFILSQSKEYLVIFTIYDDWNHQIHPSDNLNLKVNFPPKYFHVDFSSPNGTYHIIRTEDHGSTKIHAKLIGAGNAELTTPIELSQEITIYPLKQFSLDTTGINGITNLKTYLIPIKIIGYSSKKNMINFGHFKFEDESKPIKCEMYFDNSKTLWESEIYFDEIKEQWTCKFLLKSTIDIKELNLNSTVTIAANLLLKDYEHDFPMYSSVALPFLPAFYFSPKKVVFSAYQRDAVISVISVPPILQDIVISSVPEVIQVKKVDTLKNTMNITIHLKDFDLIFHDGVFHLHLNLKSKLTMQNEPVLVEINWNEIKQQEKDYSLFTLVECIWENATFFAVLIAIISVTITYIFSIKKPRIQSQILNTTNDPSNLSFKNDLNTSMSGSRALDSSWSKITVNPSSPQNRIGRPLYTADK